MAAPATLKIAEVLADLTDLRVADPNGALALVRAHKESSNSIQPPSKPLLKNRGSSRSTTPLRTPREDTPKLEAIPSTGDEDMDRAQSLLRLFETRGQAQEAESQTLARCREKVDRIAARFGVSN